MRLMRGWGEPFGCWIGVVVGLFLVGGVFVRAAADEVCGVFGFVFFDFGEGGVEGVYAQLVGQADEVDEDVANFFADFFDFFGGELAALLGSEPLEYLEDFGGFAGEGHGEIFGVVELLPVAFGDELLEALAEVV